MKISSSLPRASFHWQQIPRGTRAICILGGCALVFFLFKKAVSYFSSNTPPPRLASPTAPVLNPAPTDPSLKLQDYLRETLLLTTTELFSKHLGTQLKDFSSRGITTLEDLQSLDLCVFSENFEEFNNEKDAIIIKDSRNIGINGKIKSLLMDIEEFLPLFSQTNEPMQMICSSRGLQFDLSKDIQDLQTSLKALQTKCATACNRKPELENNKQSLTQLLDQLKELDRKRQLHWLKNYLLQQDLLKFWDQQKPNIQQRSLSVYKGLTAKTTRELFQLGFS